MKYLNPKLGVVIEDWPMGRQRKGKMVFAIEAHKEQERAIRYSVDSTGKPSAVKKLTFQRKARIVEGEDGKLYILSLTEYGYLKVMKGTFDFQHETIDDKDPRFPELVRFFDAPAPEERQ